MKRTIDRLLLLGFLSAIFLCCPIPSLSTSTNGQHMSPSQQHLEQLPDDVFSNVKKLEKKRLRKKRKGDPQTRAFWSSIISLAIVGLIIPLGLAISNLGGIILLIVLGIPLSLFFGIRGLVAGLKSSKQQDQVQDESLKKKGKIGLALAYLALLANAIFIGFVLASRI